GGIEQGLSLQDPSIPFLDIVAKTLPYLRMRTWAGALMTIGHVAFAISLVRIFTGATRPAGEPTLLAVPKRAAASLP
ncbi:MAG: hypothetical protein ABI680_01975, partial [Chthoniobacteraceae bacterium]